MTVMLYAHPGPHEIHGDKFDYIIVDEDQVDEAVEKGWCLTTPEAIEKAKAAREDEENEGKAEDAAAKKEAAAEKRKAKAAAKKEAEAKEKADAEAEAAAEKAAADAKAAEDDETAEVEEVSGSLLTGDHAKTE